MQPRRNNYVGTSLQLLLLGVLVAGALNYNCLLDQYALANYRPTAEVAAFETRVTLTQPARAALYRAQPQFDAKTAFNSDCDTQPHELELGCYFRGRIYVLRIDNASLASEMDVVSAHELLHAIWARMSTAERTSMTAELERVYASVKDKELADRMAGYAQSEPGEEGNELHSILGTEYATLSPALEAHYAKYFVDRQQVVAAHGAYERVFSSRRQELEQELTTIRSEKARLSVINRQLDTYKLQGLVSAYNALVPQQNSLVDDINNRINTYQSGVDEYNDLSKSLDSQEITDTEVPAQ